MKQQVVVIHGGDSFRTYRDYIKSLRMMPLKLEYLLQKPNWKANLQKSLGASFQVLAPQMPNDYNARFAEWEIWFDRVIPFLRDSVILVGHSLGGLFLAKYLSTRRFPKKIKAAILVAAPNNNSGEIGDFRLPQSLRRMASQVEQITLFHSTDDPIVPYTELAVFSKALPTARCVTLKRRGHFVQATFPEIVHLIQTLR